MTDLATHDQAVSSYQPLLESPSDTGGITKGGILLPIENSFISYLHIKSCLIFLTIYYYEDIRNK